MSLDFRQMGEIYETDILFTFSSLTQRRHTMNEEMRKVGYDIRAEFGIKFIGTLTKGNVNYYFEIRDREIGFTADDRTAYIEKTFAVGGRREDEHYGYFTVEEARKCYKALLAKGFKASR